MGEWDVVSESPFNDWQPVKQEPMELSPYSQPKPYSGPSQQIGEWDVVSEQPMTPQKAPGEAAREVLSYLPGVGPLAASLIPQGVMAGAERIATGIPRAAVYAGETFLRAARGLSGGPQGLKPEGYIDQMIDSVKRWNEGYKPLTPDQKEISVIKTPWAEIKLGDIDDAMTSLGYSISNMIVAQAARIGAGALAAPAGPVAMGVAGAAGGFAAGTGFTGLAMYDQFLEQARDQYLQQPKASEEGWDKLREELKSDAMWYGFWEAAPETAGNLISWGILKFGQAGVTKIGLDQLKKKVAKSIAAKVALEVGMPIAKLGGMLTEELATETLTQKKQGELEYNQGMRDHPPTWTEAFREIAPSVTVMTPLMALGIGAVQKIGKTEKPETGQATDMLTGKTEPRPEEVKSRDDARDILNYVGEQQAAKEAQAAQELGIPELGPAVPAESVIPPGAPISPERVGDLYGVPYTSPETAGQQRVGEAVTSLYEPAAPKPELGKRPIPYTTKEKVEEVMKYGKKVYEGGAFIEEPAKEPAKMAVKEKGETFNDYVATLSETEKGYIKDLIKDTTMRDAERIDLAKTEILARKEKSKIQYQKDLQVAEKKTAKPTEEQIKTGEYKKGEVGIHGYTAIVETKKGDERVAGIPVKHPVGELKGTKGKDGDPLDVILGPEGDTTNIFVIDQMVDGKFDEHKVMMGFKNAAQARIAHRTTYGKTAQAGRIIEMTKSDFDRWVAKGDRTIPASEQPVISEKQWLQDPSVRPPGYVTKKYLPGAKGSEAQVINRTILAEYRQWVKNMGYFKPAPTQKYEAGIAAERKDKRPAPVRYLEMAVIAEQQAYIDQQEKSIMGEMKELPFERLSPGELQEHTDLNTEQKLGMWLAKLLGVDLSFYTGPKLTMSGAFITGPNTIAIHADTDKPAIFVLMHEVTHNMRAEAPKVWRDLQEYLWKVRVKEDYEKFSEILNELRDASGQEPYALNPMYEENKNIITAFDEYMAEGMAHQIFKPEFWNLLQKKNPSLFTRFVAYLTKIFNKIRSKISATRTENLEYFHDLEGRTMEVITDALTKFAKRRIRAKQIQPHEKVIASAIRYKGKVYTGVSHSDAFSKIEEEVGAKVDWTQIEDDGFLTDRGRYIDRDEAKLVAAWADQISQEESEAEKQGYTWLVSEDLIKQQDLNIPTIVKLLPGLTEKLFNDTTAFMKTDAGKALSKRMMSAVSRVMKESKKEWKTLSGKEFIGFVSRSMMEAYRTFDLGKNPRKLTDLEIKGIAEFVGSIIKEKPTGQLLQQANIQITKETGMISDKSGKPITFYRGEIPVKSQLGPDGFIKKELKREDLQYPDIRITKSRPAIYFSRSEDIAAWFASSMSYENAPRAYHIKAKKIATVGDLVRLIKKLPFNKEAKAAMAELNKKADSMPVNEYMNQAIKIWSKGKAFNALRRTASHLSRQEVALLKKHGYDAIEGPIDLPQGGREIAVFSNEQVELIPQTEEKFKSVQYQIDFISNIPKQVTIPGKEVEKPRKNGQIGSPLGNKLMWLIPEMISDIVDTTSEKAAHLQVRDFFNVHKEWRGFGITPYVAKTFMGQVKNYLSGGKILRFENKKEYDEVKKFREDIASGMVEYESKAYNKMLKKYGERLQLHTVKHTVRFPYTKEQSYGPSDEADIREVVKKSHPIQGDFEVEVIRNPEDGREVMNGPIFAQDRPTRLKQIVEIILKNKFAHKWYDEWKSFMKRWEGKVSKEKLVKYVKIQAILSAQRSPQVNQLSFASVVNTLENDEELLSGDLKDGGSGVSGADVYKIMNVWHGLDEESTFEEYYQKYGPKVGPYMWMGLHPQAADAVVIDRHMPKPWGYNIMWSPRGFDSQRMERAPEVIAEVAGDIIEAARMAGVSNGAAQAALWYEIRKADIMTSTYRESAQINPDLYLPKVMFVETIPEFVGPAVHYKKTLIEEGNFVYASSKDGKIKYNDYSRKDIGRRIDASTKMNEYADLVYAYEGSETMRPEPHVAFGRQPHLLKLSQARIYNGIEDLVEYMKSATERVNRDSGIPPGLKDAARVNAFANLIEQTGVYDGFLYKQNNNRVIALFKKAAVYQAPESITLAVSDVVEKYEKMPQTISEMQEILQARVTGIEKGLRELVKKTTPFKIDTIDGTIARFGDVTSGLLEVGAMVRGVGPSDASKAFGALWGLIKRQNFIKYVRGIRKGEAPTGDNWFIPIKKEYEKPSDLQDKINQYQIGNINIGIRQLSGRLFVEQYFDHEGEYAPTPEQITAFGDFLADVGQPGSTIEVTPSVGENLTPNTYLKNLTDYFGEKEGNRIYEEAKSRGEEYIEKIIQQSAGVNVEKQGVQTKKDLKKRGPGDFGIQRQHNIIIPDSKDITAIKPMFHSAFKSYVGSKEFRDNMGKAGSKPKKAKMLLLQAMKSKAHPFKQEEWDWSLISTWLDVLPDDKNITPDDILDAYDQIALEFNEQWRGKNVEAKLGISDEIYDERYKQWLLNNYYREAYEQVQEDYEVYDVPNLEDILDYRSWPMVFRHGFVSNKTMKSKILDIFSDFMDDQIEYLQERYAEFGRAAGGPVNNLSNMSALMKSFLEEVRYGDETIEQFLANYEERIKNKYPDFYNYLRNMGYEPNLLKSFLKIEWEAKQFAGPSEGSGSDWSPHGGLLSEMEYSWFHEDADKVIDDEINSTLEDLDWVELYGNPSNEWDFQEEEAVVRKSWIGKEAESVPERLKNVKFLDVSWNRDAYNEPGGTDYREVQVIVRHPRMVDGEILEYASKSANYALDATKSLNQQRKKLYDVINADTAALEAFKRGKTIQEMDAIFEESVIELMPMLDDTMDLLDVPKGVIKNYLKSDAQDYMFEKAYKELDNITSLDRLAFEKADKLKLKDIDNIQVLKEAILSRAKNTKQAIQKFETDIKSKRATIKSTSFVERPRLGFKDTTHWPQDKDVLYWIRFDTRFEEVKTGKFKEGREVISVGEHNKKVGQAEAMAGDETDLLIYQNGNFIGRVRPETALAIHGETKKIKVLYIQEIQSQWISVGSSEGFMSEHKVVPGETINPELKGFYVIEVKGSPLLDPDEEIRYFNTKESAEQWILEKTVPDAPLVSLYHIQALKRMIHYAVEAGYDKVAMTTGEQQVKRWNQLAKDVGIVKYHPERKLLEAFKKDGGLFGRYEDIPKASLKDYIGKLSADSLLSSDLDKDGFHTTYGVKIGGAFLRKLYDKTIPRAINKIFDTENWGFAKFVGYKYEKTPEGKINEVTPYYKRINLRKEPQLVTQDETYKSATLMSKFAYFDMKAFGRTGAEFQTIFRSPDIYDKILGMTSYEATTKYGDQQNWENRTRSELNNALEKFKRETAKVRSLRTGTGPLPNAFKDFEKGIMGIYKSVMDNYRRVDKFFQSRKDKSAAILPDQFRWWMDERISKTNELDNTIFHSARNLVAAAKAYFDLKSTPSAEISGGEWEIDVQPVSLKEAQNLYKQNLPVWVEMSMPNRELILLNDVTHPEQLGVATVLTSLKGDEEYSGNKFYTIDPKNAIDELRATWVLPITEKMKQKVLKEPFALYNADLQSTIPASTKKMMHEKIGPAGLPISQKLINAWKDFKRNFVTRNIDRLHPIKQWFGETSKAYMLARGIPGVQSSLQALMEHGKLEIDESGALITNTRNKGFLEWYGNLGKDAEKFFYWLVAKRAESLKNEPESREFLFDDNDIKKILDWVGERPSDSNYASWDAINTEFKEWNNNVLDMAQKTGLISKEFRDYMASQGYYIPFYRVLMDEDARVQFMNTKMRPKEIAAQIKKLRGSDRPIGDPVENILRNWSHLVSETVHNEARRESYAYAVKNNLIARTETDDEGNEVEVPLIETVSWADTVRFKKVGKEKGAPTFVSKKDGYPVLQFRAAGKSIYFKVNDPELFNALGQMDPPAFDNIIMSIFGKGKRALTFGATFGPAFRVKNFLRDTLHTFQISKGFIPLWSSIAGLYKVWTKHPDYIKFMASGMAFGGSYLREGDPAAYRKFVNTLVKKEGRGVLGRIIDTPMKALHWWNEFGEGFENAARVELYSRLRRKGKSHLEAAFSARDLMDFNMSGNGQALKVLISTVPFMNARIQGLYKMGRAAQENPGSFFAKSALIAMASLVLWWFNKDDDRYKELEDFEKFAWYHFWVGDTHYRIPKPFETGVLFSTSVEVAGDVITGNEELNHVFDYLAQAFLDTFAFNPTPQAIRPIWEQFANKTFFTGRPIESVGMQRREPGQRSDPWDSETLRLLGDKLNVSPKRMQHLIQGYLSTFGAFLLGMSDIMVRNIVDFPERPTKRIDDYPFAGAFLREAENPRYTKYMTSFFDMYKSANQLAATVTNYRRTGDMESARRMTEKYRDTLAFSKRLNVVYKQLSDISVQMKKIWSSKTMTPEQKKVELDRLTKRRNSLVRQVMNEYKKGEGK